MLRKLLLVVSICGFAGCKDILYQDEIPKEKVPYAFSGIVELGAPVSGAKITAHKFAGLKKGEKIADAMSNRDGSFDLKFSTDYEGPLLLTANGGLYRDLTTHETIAVKPEQELKSAITHITMPERTNINAWTTMAVARVMADRGFWDKGVARLKDRERIDVDFNHIAKFLSGQSNTNINIRRQELLDLDVENTRLELSEAKTLFHLAHGGLSQLARMISGKLPAGYSVSVPDLVSALSEDLTDRVFDGKDAHGLPVYLGFSRNLNLSSQTMRKDFSESILLYGESIKNWNEAYRLKLGELVGPIATDRSPEFFPEKEQPVGRDVSPPKIFVSFSSDRSSENAFAVMKGEVFFNVKATDETGVAGVRSIAPRPGTISEAGKLGPFGTDFVQNPQMVANECGKEVEFFDEVGKRKLNPLDLVCACFEAKDVFGNAQNALSCFQREKISSAIAFPYDGALLSKKELLNGLSVKAEVTSGVNLASCEWWITKDPSLNPEEANELKGQGLILNNSCKINEDIAAEAFSNGEYRLVIIAKDIFERELSIGNFGNQDNVVGFKVMIEPPLAKILSPRNGEFISARTIKMVGSFENRAVIDRITVSYLGVDENNKDMNGNFDVSLESAKNIWEAELGFNLPAGQYELGLTISDKYGNERVMEQRTIILDESRPTITHMTHIISTKHIAGYRQIFAQNKAETDRIEPIFMTQRNEGNAEFHRWSSEVFDKAKAPGFRFSIKDDNKLKEIKYVLDETCSNIENAQILRGNNGVYEIKIIQENSRTSLLSSKELCLSLWASDHAGNIERKNVLMSWKVSVPPVSVHLNSANFKNGRMGIDDAIWVVEDYEVELKRGVELGYAVMSNPFLIPLETSLELEKPMILTTISIGAALSFFRVENFLDKEFKIPASNVEIEYFNYDSKNDKIGARIYPYRSDKVLLKAASSVIAKFIIKKSLRFQAPITKGSGFGFRFDFGKSRGKFAAVKINMGDPRNTNEYSYMAYYPASPVLQLGFGE